MSDSSAVEIDQNLIAKAKKACRVVNVYYDDEIADLVAAALKDLSLGDVDELAQDDPLIIQAVCTYCRMKLGNPENYERLKASYDEQKAQLGMASGYTNWGTTG